MTTVPARRLVTAVLATVLTLALAMPLSVAMPPARASAAPVTTADLRAVAFADTSVGYAVGTGGTIVRTVDGGATWAVTRSGGGYDLRGVSAKAGNVWAVSQSGALIRKTDPGWEVRHENVGDPFYLPDLRDVDIISAGAGMAFGGLADTDEAPVAFSSFDGGEQWPFNLVYKAREYPASAEDPTAKDTGLGTFHAADFPSSDLGWAVGSDEFKELFGDKTQHDDGIVYNYDTSRGYGENAWLKQASFAGTGPLYGVSFGSTAWGIAVGAGGRAYHTTDGGTTWTQGNTGVTSALRAVATAGPPSSEAWAVGDGGVILRTADGGATWTQLMNPTGAVALRGVAAAGGTTAVAVGASGTILRTTNGSDWQQVGVPPAAALLASQTHPVSGTWYASRDASFGWWPAGNATQYSYVFDKSPSTEPDNNPETSDISANVTANSDGVWYFHIKATDGSTWGATSHRAVRIDATKPTLNHDAASAYTSSASITLTAEDTGGSGLKEIRYTLDGGSEVVVSGSPATVTTSDVGSHALAARSYDHAGNASDQLSVEFTVYAPATISEIQSPTHASDTAWHDSRGPVEFTWTGTPAVGYSYVFDKVSGTVPDQVQDTASPSASVSADSDGEWWFHVRGVNGAGAWGPAQHRRVRVDATPPTLDSDAQASYVGWANILLTASDTGGSGLKEIRYTLDGGSEVVVSSSPATVTTSDVGSHALAARSYDHAGNASAELPVDFEVIVGEVPRVIDPNSSTHPVPSTWYPSRDVSFSWTAGGGATQYSYVFDKNTSTVPDDDPETSGTSADVTADSDGVWYFHIKAGNGSVWGETARPMVRIDATKPTLDHDAKTSYTGSASITLTAADTGGSDLKEIRYRLDGGSEVVVSGSPATVTTSVLGSHTLTARSYDDAGNASDAKTISFTVGTAYVRVEGSDRFGTAVAISKKAFATADTVVIATGYNWPDALGGAALAKAYDGPILLVKPNEVPRVVMDEIVRLRAKNAVILGSANAVSSGVENALKAKLGSTKVTRLGGRDRYETANMVAAATVKRLGGAYDGKAFVATGGNFPDALAASPLAAAKGWPIYLTKDTGLPSNVRSAMKAAKVTKPIILGSTSAVPGVVENDLKAAFGTGNVSRLFGDNRYATAVKVAAYGVAQAGLHWDRLAIGTGENFPDALAGGVLQGKHGSVMLLTPGKALDPGVKNLLAAKKAEIREVRYLGSDNAVSLAVRNAVKAILYK